MLCLITRGHVDLCVYTRTHACVLTENKNRYFELTNIEITNEHLYLYCY